ncbi:hypothetical protein NN6n1_16920 [Shinella zoogloeoides]
MTWRCGIFYVHGHERKPAPLHKGEIEIKGAGQPEDCPARIFSRAASAFSGGQA